jgi:hypothetical protein
MMPPVANAERLRSVINGDWTPYEKRTAFTTIAFGEEQATEGEFVEYDWGLLRHDIHVLFHHATAVQH